MSLSREIIDPVQNRARAKDQNQPSRPDRVAAENSDNSVEVISTGARLNVLVASRPPKPAPSVTTVGFDCGIVLTTAMSSLARQCGSVSPLFYRCTAEGFAPRRDRSSPRGRPIWYRQRALKHRNRRAPFRSTIYLAQRPDSQSMDGSRIGCPFLGRTMG